MTIKDVIEAMKHTQRFTDFAWWLDGPVERTLFFAEKQGWVRRISTTQIEWTQKGAEAVDDYQN